MEIDPKVQKDGIQWLLLAGLGAILLCCFLAYSDHYLSTSDSEQRLGERLHELRSAQASLPANPADKRQDPNAAAGERRGDLFPVELTEFEGYESHADHSGSHAGDHADHNPAH